MANLGALAEGAYAGYRGYQNEDDYLYGKQRSRLSDVRNDAEHTDATARREVLRGREDERYKRQLTLDSVNDRILNNSVEDYDKQRALSTGADEADRLAGEQWGRDNPTDGSTAAPPTGPTRAQAQREARAKFYESKGRSDLAGELRSKDALQRFNDRELEFKIKMQPQEEQIRRDNVPLEKMQQDAKYQDYFKQRSQFVKEQTVDWFDMVDHGNDRGALEAFNNSRILDAGVKATEIRKSPDGKMIALFGDDGQPVKDKQGQPMVYPVEALKQLRNQVRPPKLIPLDANKRLLEQSRDGTFTEKVPVAQEPDKKAAQRNTRIDNLRQSIDAMLFKGGGAFADIDAEKQELRRIAGPIAEKLSDDGMPEEAAAAKAISMAQDIRAREKSGAGAPAKGAGGGDLGYDLYR